MNNEKYLKRKFNSNCKTIRVFVSSTFTDFFNEREILVKQVGFFFKQIRLFKLTFIIIIGFS